MDVIGFLLFLIGVVIVGCLIVGAGMVVLEALWPVLELLAIIWPFVLGCIIGIPLSLHSDTRALGNIIVALGIVGNILWVAWLVKK